MNARAETRHKERAGRERERELNNFFINISHTMSFAVSTSSFAGAKVALRKQQNVQKKQSTMVRAAAVSGEVPVRRYRFFFLAMDVPLKNVKKRERNVAGR